MFTPPDYSLVDRTPLARSMFYPRTEWAPAPVGATDIAIPVEEGIAVSARFYRYSVVTPTLLFFHGNGEVAVEYDNIAHFYRQAGVNLIVVDYRGYGASGGEPTFATMMADAHTIFKGVQAGLAQEGFSGPLFVMGRSLGAHSAAELAAHYPDALAGLIVESGASGVARMVTALTELGMGAEAEELAQRHTAKLQSIRIPALVMHGEKDELLALETALAFYETLQMPDKELVIIPNAGHNDIMFVGLTQYFTTLRDFVQAHS